MPERDEDAEVGARVDAGVGAAMADFADRVISIAVDYLHPEDVRQILDEHVAWRTENAVARGEVIEWPRRNRERFGLARELRARREGS
jgi:hypothetical protein